jgi:hypothetical protein
MKLCVEKERSDLKERGQICKKEVDTEEKKRDLNTLCSNKGKSRNFHRKKVRSVSSSF